jgi:hypothetical protein
MVNVNELQEVDLQFDRSNWLTEELETALDLLPTEKHRTTILRLTEGRVIGRSDEDTFRLPDVCSKKTWHGPHRNGRTHPGWKDDPLMQKALMIAENCLTMHHEATIIANINNAYRHLAEAAVKAVMTLEVLMDASEDDLVKLKAANSVLDRVDKTFSRKTTTVAEQRSISFDLSQVPPDMLNALAEGETIDGEYKAVES